ncbi:MAG: VOC family protein [Candidatus Pedobacter colombiensis]|uniref:VOC family protein n=1 Tax=Candidatus Pedobacter colombiensis TaxID=3121371 RepID=A0AAJ5W4M0_9SPHI|nr:VOC family protein [Pedobacter sp.]WEK18051.1 MAG: VOC family protein [Pedobacter sp.]
MKAFILTALLAIILTPFQSAMAQTEKKKNTVVLNHIAVYVADLKVATDFYQTVFDLEIIPEPFKDGRHTWFSIGAAGHLHLIQGAKSNVVHEKNDHLCFSVASVDEFAEKLKVKQINFENWAGAHNTITKRVDGIKQIYFKDPDGHWLEVNDDYK